MEDRMKDLERMMERREKKDRRRNVIIKGLEVRDGKRKEGGRGGVVKHWSGGGSGSGRDKESGEGDGRRKRDDASQGSERGAGKKEIMRKKSRLKGRKKIIGDNLIWRERRMKWKLEEIAREKERKDNKM